MKCAGADSISRTRVMDRKVSANKAESDVVKAAT